MTTHESGINVAVFMQPKSGLRDARRSEIPAKLSLRAAARRLAVPHALVKGVAIGMDIALLPTSWATYLSREDFLRIEKKLARHFQSPRAVARRARHRAGPP